jgi:hypothetical protein
MSPLRFGACACVGLGVNLTIPATGQTPADFKGETITIQIGYGPGGGYDTYGRALGRPQPPA